MSIEATVNYQLAVDSQFAEICTLVSQKERNMQDAPENEEDQIHDQRTENELKKIKLALEHGMDMSQSFTDPDLPPELEGEFLDYMQQWEDQYAQRKRTTVFEM